MIINFYIISQSSWWLSTTCRITLISTRLSIISSSRWSLKMISWRTSAFIHSRFLHIIINLIFLYPYIRVSRRFVICFTYYSPLWSFLFRCRFSFPRFLLLRFFLFFHFWFCFFYLADLLLY